MFGCGVVGGEGFCGGGFLFAGEVDFGAFCVDGSIVETQGAEWKLFLQMGEAEAAFRGVADVVGVHV